MPTRLCLCLLSLALLLGTCAPEAAGQIADPVRVESGRLSGAFAADSSVRAYRGIPYAAPPVDDRRWQPPQPPHPWSGVRRADTFPPGCMQATADRRLPWNTPFLHQGPVSEDCLYLNVWTAAASPEASRPVLVWIHGGGFTEGSGSIPIYRGTELAKEGPVVVTINYRLGVFGFLAHPGLSDTSDRGASGNYGLLDQVAALRWVRDNIAAFGGDPDNVTIAGQSAGALSAYLLTAAPDANGLFDRAILQSGPGGLAAFGLCSPRERTRPLAAAESSGVHFAERVGAQSVAGLRALSADSLLSAASSASGPRRFWPVTGGPLLPRPPTEVYAVGEQADVPTLMGFNADEASFFPSYGTVTAETFRAQVRDCFGAAADTLLRLYPTDPSRNAGAVQKAALRDRAAAALQQLAERRAETSTTDAYLYFFERAHPWPEHPEFGAFHTAEVPYVFNTLDALDRPWTTVDRRLADTMAAYWARFAATGNPNGGNRPAWRPYAEAPTSMMTFGPTIEMRPRPPTDARRSFFETHLSASDPD